MKPLQAGAIQITEDEAAYFTEVTEVVKFQHIGTCKRVLKHLTREADRIYYEYSDFKSWINHTTARQVALELQDYSQTETVSQFETALVEAIENTKEKNI